MKHIILPIKLLIVLFIIYVSCICYDSTKPIEIGGKYQICIHSCDDNPFEQADLDTVTVISCINGYVQFMYNDSTKHSVKITTFKSYAHPL